MPHAGRLAIPPGGFLHNSSTYSKSTPDLPTLRSLSMSPDRSTSGYDESSASSPPKSSFAGSDQSGPNSASLNDMLQSPVGASLSDSASSSASDQDSGNEAANAGDEHGNHQQHQQQHQQHHPRNNANGSGSGRPYAHSRLGSGSRSHSYLHPSASQLFPPFYNRPPTPLPPSPSLTSLLRPSFSTHTSHHTTPESSDVESATLPTLPGSSASISASAAAAAATSPVPPANPKVPTYEYYGFALHLASWIMFLMYVLWAYLPSPFLHQLGICYYPDRWWALAVPAWLAMGLGYIYVALASYNTGHLTLSMNSLGNMVDVAGKIAVVDRDGRIVRSSDANKSPTSPVKSRKAGRNKGRNHSRQNSAVMLFGAPNLGKDVDWGSLWSQGTDAVMDVPIGGVCEILYGEGS
jgi:phosphatidylinositol glycan class P protein